jgi:hypothetical protein
MTFQAMLLLWFCSSFSFSAPVIHAPTRTNSQRLLSSVQLACFSLVSSIVLFASPYELDSVVPHHPRRCPLVRSSAKAKAEKIQLEKTVTSSAVPLEPVHVSLVSVVQIELVVHLADSLC